MPTAVFEPAIPAGERPQTYVLDSADTGNRGRFISYHRYKCYNEMPKIMSHC